MPGSNVDYVNTYSCGGAYIDVVGGSNALVAAVHLPHGAEVTEFEVFFNDASSDDMLVRLHGQRLTGCGWNTMAEVNSSGTDGYYSITESTISNSIIDNRQYSYSVYAHSYDWSSSLMIKGAVITYTIE